MLKIPSLPSIPPLPTRFVARYLIVLFTILFLIANYALWTRTQSWDIRNLRSPLNFGSRHPIKELMKEARAAHDEKLSRRSYTVKDAAERYRQARGRHPPPGFDGWVEAALDDDAIIVEDYFDRIYKDLGPWWAIEAETIRNRAYAWEHVVRVRKGEAQGVGDVTDRVPWLQLWTGLVKEFSKHLPDVDMPINYMDESRLLVPFDEVARLVSQEQTERTMPASNAVDTEYSGLAEVDAAKPKLYNPSWSGPDNPYWDLAVKACGPESPAYGVEAVTDFTGPAEFPQDYRPGYEHEGFIHNWTAAMDPCEQPHLRQLHGTFVEPISLSSSEELIPLFGGSKLPINNEILIPGAMYLTDDEFYSGGKAHGAAWPLKKEGVVWRGDASGGRVHPQTWHHFHRHRLIDMFNATKVGEAESSEESRYKTFELPDTTIYKSPHTLRKDLSSWVAELADAGFVHMCAPGDCDFIYDFYKEIDPKPMSEQYEYKLLPDADGNSFSARFRGFMRSTSAPLKATIYSEWHDDRLTPWVHFIPMDNTFRDLYPLLEFFADGDGNEGDTAARFIAEKGQEWAEKVLRRKDMKLYVWRLLLEWARVCDDKRHNLGYVADLQH